MSNGVAEASPTYLAEMASSAVPAGYKQTEVGVIPVDWKVKAYGEVFAFLSTSTNSRSDLSEEGDFGYVHYGDIHTEWNNKLDLNKERLPRISKNIVSSAFVMDGDLIMADASEDYEGIGKTVEVFNVGDKQLVAGLHTFLLRDKEKVLAEGFRGYLHNIPAVKSTFDRLATGMKVYGISKNNLLSVCIPVPSLEEQTAIANVLSDLDALISELEKLIAKKQAIKTATMQQLLTGRTRLPQFALREDGTTKGTKPSELGEIPEDWGGVELGSVIEKFIGGGTPSRSNGEYWGSQIPWVTVKDFATFNPYSAQESITKKGLISSASNLIPKGTLITSTRMALGKAVIYQIDVAINQDMKALVCGQELSTEFLYFWFEANKNKIDELGSGSTVKGLSLPDLRKVSFLLPSKQEQTAIATILSDMDEEIQALEQRLGKTRQIKQGMMQELLTGKTRLIKPVKGVIHE